MTNRTETTAPATEESSPPPAADTCYQGKLPCQICGGRLIEIRAKLQCERCHTIWETCCEGGRG